MGNEERGEEVKGLILVWNFLRRRKGSLDPLCEYFESRRRQLFGHVQYVGMFGLVRVHNDCYGYEVRIGWPWAPMLDSEPAYYGLTSAQSDRLLDAVLSCVPSSCAYADKQVRQGRMIGDASD